MVDFHYWSFTSNQLRINLGEQDEARRGPGQNNSTSFAGKQKEEEFPWMQTSQVESRLCKIFILLSAAP